ncbi:MAG TPA: 3-hydroxyacyl-CoA dehydrogenase NAD-binding domain-containing protein [Terriglobia bacterium]|nr:3-hydroxyacyl-CoA dehydrogenase NAD-binding domain-containing protein [Terriglobia bacterium]
MRQVRKVAVLGAGTMGAAIAAHIANARIPCLLLDRIPDESGEGPGASDPKFRNRLAQAGLDAALKARPAAFFVPEAARLITTGNFEDHLSRVGDCDWVIEAVTENIRIKRALLERLQPHLSPGTIVSSNTSGISVGAIAQGFSEQFRRHWLGAHFFNPPRYMKLLEIIPTEETLPEVEELISRFGDEVLGKGIVRAKDRPNFIANRVGVFFGMTVLRLMEEEGFSVEEIDLLTGPVIGLPKSATFRTLDLVGLDLHAHVLANLRESLPDDEQRDVFQAPDFMARMIKRKLLGEKTRQGFYRKSSSTGSSGESVISVLDFSTFEYRPQRKPNLPAIDMVKGIEDTAQRVHSLLEAPDRTGRFYQKLFGQTFHYAARLIPEISNEIVSVDNAMKWGFNWECGPFELWDAIGVERIVDLWKSEQRVPPPLVEKLLSLDEPAFYRGDPGKTEFFDLRSGDYIPVPERPGVLLLSALKAQGREVKKNAGASLIDLGDGVLCLEFHSKLNTVGLDAVQMIHNGLKALNADFDAMVIGNQGANFSAGANLMLLLLAIQESDWDEVHRAVRAFQNVNVALKYASKPVVAAPFGLTLGGGTEIALHCASVVAAAETYLGLVETSVGLVPAGGGAKEMLLRAMDLVPEDGDPFPFLKDVFTSIGNAKVSTSAADARTLGYLSARDVVLMNRDRQITIAKQEALNAAKLGYHPGKVRDDIVVFGTAAFSRMRHALHLMRRAEYISAHDLIVGTHLARILSGGGEFTGPQRVSEQFLLDLEREAFVSLCGEKKTVERIQHTLKTGKPLRN